jgi:Ca2+-binding RTX toxin-like protein
MKLVLCTALAAAAALVAAPGAGAAVTCQFDESFASLTVLLSATANSAAVEPDGSGGIDVSSASGEVDCGGSPTTTNTDIVTIEDVSDNGSTFASIVNPAGFAPGKTEEQGSSQYAEIEFNVRLRGGESDGLEVLGEDSADAWRIGSAGVNWNLTGFDPAPDVDLQDFSGVETFNLDAGGGNDLVSARGELGTGAPWSSRPLLLIGGAGDDSFQGGDATGGDTVIGGPGDDILFGFGGDDTITPGPGTNHLIGGAGVDEINYAVGSPPPGGVTVDLSTTAAQSTGMGIDSVTGIEDIWGTRFDDRLVGDDGPNLFQGEEGDDVLVGGAGNDDLRGGVGNGGSDGADTLAGGPGDDRLNGGSQTDTVSFAGSPTGVVVNLATGVASGEGNDSVPSNEDIVGSPFADTLTGNALPNRITGLGGADAVSALAGPDTVDVRDGEADTASCGSELDAASADAASIDQVASDCEAVSFPPAPEPEPEPEPEPGPAPGPEPGGGGPPPSVDTDVTFDLSGKRKQRVATRRRVVVTAICPAEDCTVRFGGRVKPRTESLVAGVTERIRLKPKRRRARKFRVTAQASDAAGNSAVDSVRVRAR